MATQAEFFQKWSLRPWQNRSRIIAPFMQDAHGDISQLLIYVRYMIHVCLDTPSQ